jgi:hypothetical protein
LRAGGEPSASSATSPTCAPHHHSSRSSRARRLLAAHRTPPHHHRRPRFDRTPVRAELARSADDTDAAAPTPPTPLADGPDGPFTDDHPRLPSSPCGASRTAGPWPRRRGGCSRATRS